MGDKAHYLDIIIMLNNIVGDKARDSKIRDDFT